MAPLSRNRNVRAALVYAATSSLSLGVWSFTVLSAFLQQMPAGNNAKVGLAEGVQGAFMAAAALLAGFLADRVGRQRVLRASAGLGLLAVGALLLTLTVGRNDPEAEEANVDERNQFALMCASLALFGAFQGASSAPLEALFHDSLRVDERAKAAVFKYALTIAFVAGGPATSIILFQAQGDSWGFGDLTLVMAVGVILTAVPIATLVFMRDADALGRESEPLTYESPGLNVRTGGRNEDDFWELEDEAPRTPCRVTDGEALQDPLLEVCDEEGAPGFASNEASAPQPPSKAAAWWVPRIVVFTDMISGLASGVTVKFFPLFFKATGLSPSAVSLIFVVSPLLTVACSSAAYRLSKQLGRVKVPLLTNSVGILLLVLMYVLGQINDEALWRDWRVIVPIYLLRTALMNSTSPLRKSILMDFVSKENRGFVNSLESVSAFGWSGSAAIGGVLTENYGYGGSFLATAAMQAVALSIFSALLFFKVR